MAIQVKDFKITTLHNPKGLFINLNGATKEQYQEQESDDIKMDDKDLGNGTHQIKCAFTNSVISKDEKTVLKVISEAIFEITIVSGKIFDLQTPKDTAIILNQIFKTMYDQNRAYILGFLKEKMNDYQDSLLPYYSNELMMAKTFAFTTVYLQQRNDSRLS